jgi:hypothetical protein
MRARVSACNAQNHMPRTPRYFFAAVLAASILSALARHVLQGYVGLPPWVEAVSAGLVAVATVRCGAAVLMAAALGVGAIVSCALPATLAPPTDAVLTGKIPLARGVDLFDALAKLDDDPSSLEDRRITVSGVWKPAASGELAAVYRVVMACCAADAVDVGFDVAPAHRVGPAAGTVVKVSGRVTMTVRSGETRWMLRDATVRAAGR